MGRAGDDRGQPLLLRTRVIGRLNAWAARRRRSLAGRALLFVPVYGLLTGLLTLPYAVWTDFYSEAHYGLNNQSLAHGLGDLATLSLADLVLTSLLVIPILPLVRRSPKMWRLWGTGVVFAGLLFASAIAPVAIDPLLNRYAPLTQEPLRGELLSLARANSVPARQILIQDASKQTKKISANVSGLGGTARVAPNDNLLATHDVDMIRAILGHEMGHYLLGHVWRQVLGLALLALAGLLVLQAVVPALLRLFGARWGVRMIYDPGVVPVAVIVFAAFGLIATPLQNTLVRTTEAQADIFGLNAARPPDGFARAALTLSQYRKLEPSAFEETVSYDHPSGRSRIRMAMCWKAEHLGQADIR